MAIQTVSIVGVGLIGGSFGLALRKAGFSGKIIGVSSERTTERALELGVIDEARPLAKALPESDLVYLAQPVSRILAELPLVRQHVRDDAVVTDAGSTKAAIVARAAQLFSPGGPCFVGGHPMAGRAGRGVEIAEARLFEGATYVLTPTNEQIPKIAKVAAFEEFLGKMGCRVRFMDAATHDQIVAWTSHMPQMASTALAAAVLANVTEPADLKTAGDGLLDMTRLAASPHEMWAGILETNPGPIEAALTGLINELESLRTAIGSKQASEHFRRGNRLRKKLFEE